MHTYLQMLSLEDLRPAGIPLAVLEVQELDPPVAAGVARGTSQVTASFRASR